MVNDEVRNIGSRMVSLGRTGLVLLAAGAAGVAALAGGCAAGQPKITPTIPFERRGSEVSAEEALRAGEEALRAGDQKRARTAFDRALEICPGTSGKLLERCGRLAYALGERQTALDIWRQAAAQADAPAEAFYNISIAAWELGYRAEALVVLDRYAALRPDDVEALSRLGWLYVRQGRFDRAIQRFKDAVALAPMNVELRQGLAAAYYEARQPQEATFNLLICQEIAGPSAQIRYSLGLCAEASGKRVEAIDYYRAALDVDPDHKAVKERLDRLGVTHSETEDAWESLKKTRSLQKSRDQLAPQPRFRLDADR